MRTKYYIAFICIPFFLQSCKEQQKPVAPVAVEAAIPAPQGNYIVFEPLEKSVTKEGEAVFEKDTFTVYQEYTDGVAFKQSVKGPKNEDGIMNYREMVVHLVNKRSNDTITLPRGMFAKYLHPDDKDIMIMQSVAFAQDSKKGIVPIMVNLCQPDSDYCYFFDVRPNGKGGFTITDVSEDFDMP